MPKTNFIYIEAICRRACKKKFKSEFFFFSQFPDLQNLDVFFFGNFFVQLVWKSFLGRNNSLEPPVFDFFKVFQMIWKNQESLELWLDGSWGNRHLKTQQNSANNFSCIFELPLWIYKLL